MQLQGDTNNCGIFVTAWAENARNTGKIQNCLKIGDEKKFRNKMYNALLGRRIDNFNKENLKFFYKGEHFEHFKSFFDEVFYKQKDEKIRKQIKSFFEDLFDLKKPFTKSDLDMLTDLYKSLDKNLKK